MNFYIHYICYLNFLLPEINNPPEVISLPGDNLKYCNLNLTHIFPIIISADMILNFICTDKLKICIVHDCFCLSYCYITFHTYFTRANSYHYNVPITVDTRISVVPVLRTPTQDMPLFLDTVPM